ncbi:MAG: phosphonate metabolism transcriptional regulator PhnF [Orrella sp.]
MERTKGIALWRQISLLLADDIRNGTWQATEKLPTETNLASRFGVNRHTLRRAMAALEESGMVRIEQGRGTFVQEGLVDYPVSKRTRFTENIALTNRQPGGELIRSANIPAERDVAQALGVAYGEGVYLLELLRVADKIPLSISTHWFPASRCAGIVEAYEQSGSVTKALLTIGISDVARSSTRVTTRLPMGSEAKSLKQARSQPVLVSESVNVDARGQAVEYVLTRFAAQRVQLVFEF